MRSLVFDVMLVDPSLRTSPLLRPFIFISEVDFYQGFHYTVLFSDVMVGIGVEIECIPSFWKYNTCG